MPDRPYQFRGKQYFIDSDDPLTPREVSAILRRHLTEKFTPRESTLKKYALDPLMSTLEVAGRPAELIAGTMAGALADEKDWGRGWRAFTEGKFADSEIHETFGKLLKEQDLLSDNPYKRAALGFGLDVLTDPLNLLGGAGIARRAARQALVKKGVSRDTAEKALLIQNPVRTGFQQNVVPAMSRGIQQVKSTPGLKRLFPTIELEKITGKRGLSAEQVSYLQNRLRQVDNQQDLKKVSEWTDRHGLTPEELNIIPEAIKEPGGSAWNEIQSIIGSEANEGATRMKDAMRGFRDLTHEIWKRDVDRGLIKSTYIPKDALDDSLLDSFDKLTSQERELFEEAFSHPGIVDDNGRVVIGGSEGLAQRFNDIRASGVSGDITQKLFRFASRLVDQLEPTVKTAEGKNLILPTVNFRTLKFRRIVRRGKDGLPTESAVGSPTFSTERPNYVPQLSRAAQREVVGTEGIAEELKAYPAYAAGLRSAKQQTASWAEYVEKGGEVNAFKILKRRFESSNSAKANSELMNTWARDFVHDVKPSATEGVFTQLKPRTIEFLPDRVRQSFVTGEGNRRWVPKAIADEIQTVVQRLDDPVRFEGAIRRFVKLWKAYRTSINFPLHQANNFVGNAGAMYAATDHSAKEIADAIMLATSVVRGTRKFPTFKVGGKTYTHDQLIKIADDWGLGTKADPLFSFRGGQAPTRLGGLSQELRQTTGRGATREFLTNPETGESIARDIFGQSGGPMSILNPENPVIQKFQDINQHLVEDPAKLALMFLDLKSGKTSEQAFLNVRKVLFDYGDLRDFEKKYLRDVIPFYTWTRKTIPLQIAALAQRPAKASHARRIFDLVRDVDEASGGTAIPTEFLPEYMQRANVFPIPGMQGPEGKVYGRTQYPLFELDKVTADPEQFLKEWSFMLNPLVRMPIESAIGHPLGAPSYMSLQDPDVPSSALGRMAGTLGLGGLVGAWQDPQTDQWRQSARGRWLSRELPIPFSPFARTIDPGGASAPAVNPFVEMLMRGAALSPMGVSAETISRGRGEATRRRNAPPEDIYKRILDALMLRPAERR